MLFSHRKVLCTMIGLGAAMAMAGEDAHYTNVEMSWAGNGSTTGAFRNGVSLNGSKLFSDSLFAVASVLATNGDRRTGVDSYFGAVGVGMRHELTGDMDLVTALTLNVRVNYANATGNGSASQDGGALHIGLRSWPLPELELSAGSRYANFGRSLHDVTWSAGARYYFTDKLATGFDVNRDNDGTVWKVALRWDFGDFY